MIRSKSLANNSLSLCHVHHKINQCRISFISPLLENKIVLFHGGLSPKHEIQQHLDLPEILHYESTPNPDGYVFGSIQGRLFVVQNFPSSDHNSPSSSSFPFHFISPHLSFLFFSGLGRVRGVAIPSFSGFHVPVDWRVARHGFFCIYHLWLRKVERDRGKRSSSAQGRQINWNVIWQRKFQE